MQDTVFSMFSSSLSSWGDDFCAHHRLRRLLPFRFLNSNWNWILLLFSCVSLCLSMYMYCIQVCACRCSYTWTEGKKKDTRYLSVSFSMYFVLNLSVPHSLETKSFSDPEARLSTSKRQHHVTSLHSLGGYFCNINTPGFYQGAKDEFQVLILLQ